MKKDDESPTWGAWFHVDLQAGMSYLNLTFTTVANYFMLFHL